MTEAALKTDWWSVEIEGMPQFDQSMKRVYAWFENQIIDRAPVRFQAHNAFLNAATEEVSKLSKEEKKVKKYLNKYILPAIFSDGSKVLIHCRGGHHRTGWIAGIIRKCFFRGEKYRVKKECKKYAEDGYRQQVWEFIKTFKCSWIDKHYYQEFKRYY